MGWGGESSQSTNHLKHGTSPLEPQAKCQSQVLRLFQKAKKMGVNLILRGRMFQRIDISSLYSQMDLD